MKKILLFGMFLFLIAGISACDKKDNQQSTAKRISDGMQEVMENKNGDFEKGGYIVYDSETDSLATMTPQEYDKYSKSCSF